ncbi:MAG: putative 4-deoxy-4-formamido-L-arabinose-phosphoundecaprenol deformylase ArnD [Elusimicrobia bacterium]|nr:putative 4-deoxy-4-formamido-L-arabinose-phosphoundecaprenol deformylase ArnD [Elusimicrobiota bacterium]
MEKIKRVALKVDCDTFEGTREGIPTLLRLFKSKGIRATFFFTLGPDRSGMAIRRIFTQKGFLRKMLRSNAVSLYGPKTMLYGTLLPPPMIGERLGAVIRSVEEAGHEVGVHGWDHVKWHDRLDHLTEYEIASDYKKAHDVFKNIFGKPAKASAAPGWHATPASLKVQGKFDLTYASDTRGGSPFFPMTEGEVFNFLQIPTTLPTLDEMLADPDTKTQEKLIGFYRDAVVGTEVHTIHTEVEGMRYAPFFEKLLEAWKNEGVSFLQLQEWAEENLQHKEKIPCRELIRKTIPNRGGLVSSTPEI